MSSSLYLEPLRAFASADSFVQLTRIGGYSFIPTFVQIDLIKILFNKYITLAPANSFRENLQSVVPYIPKIQKVVALSGLIGFIDKQKSAAHLYTTNGKFQKLLFVVYLVTSVAMISLRPVTAVPMLGTFAYHALDQRKMIPERVSVFMKKYGQAVGAMCSLFEQSILIRLLALNRLTTIFGIKNNIIFSWLDRVVKPAYIPSLAQIDDKSNFKLDRLTEDQITKTLSGNPLVFNVNYSMTSRSFHKFSKIEPNRNYDDFLTLSDSFGKDREAIQPFVSILNDEKNYEGPREDLKIVKKNSQIILAYLQKYQAVYGADGLDLIAQNLSNLRLATDILREVLYELELKNEQDTAGPSHDVYELNLLRKLENDRKESVSALFNSRDINIFPEFVKTEVKMAFGFGYVPLPRGKRKSLGFSHFLQKLIIGSSWKVTCISDSVKCISNMDREQTKEKILQIINESEVSDEKKAELVDEYTNTPDTNQKNNKFNKLILVKLGILTVIP